METGILIQFGTMGASRYDLQMVELFMPPYLAAILSGEGKMSSIP
jgi:hypothetical protein